MRGETNDNRGSEVSSRKGPACQQCSSSTCSNFCCLCIEYFKEPITVGIVGLVEEVIRAGHSSHLFSDVIGLPFRLNVIFGISKADPRIKS